MISQGIYWTLPGPVPGVEIELRDVTPQYAEELLSANTHNRRINSTVVGRYSVDMLADEWPFVGDPVRVEENGLLLDGQHRLAAIVMSGKTIPMIIVRGLGTDAQRSMDIGNKRTLANTFSLEGLGEVTDTSTLSALLRRITVWLHDGDMDMRSANRYSNASLYSTLGREDKELIFRAVERGGRINRVNKLIKPALGSYAYYRCALADVDAAAEFFARLESGVRSIDDPLLALDTALKRLPQYKRHGDGYKHQLALIFIAWNKFRMNQPMRVCRWSWNSEFPEPR